MLLNNQQTAGKNQEGNLKISGDKWKCKHNNPKSVRHRKKNSSKRDYSYTSLPQETRRISNKQLNLTPKGIRKKNKEQPKPKISKKERNNKDQIINK